MLVGLGFFFIVWAVLFIGGIGGLIIGVVALISAARMPSPAFGPWWDNTKTAWLLGIAVSYLIPFGLWVTSIYWFTTGKRGYDETGVVGRPFWTGPPKPYPPGPPPGYPPTAGYAPPPPLPPQSPPPPHPAPPTPPAPQN